MRDLQLWKTQFSYEKTLICLVRSVKEVGNRCIYGTVVEKTQFNSKGVGENKSKKSPSSKRTFPSLVVIFGYMGRLGRALQRFNQRLGRPGCRMLMRQNYADGSRNLLFSDIDDKKPMQKRDHKSFSQQRTPLNQKNNVNIKDLFFNNESVPL
ncbi:hypothetical protein GLOIN_2v1481953 [Rhizophagus irregularis DAOM 181602=DAOM 197198]|nr:hypothetical protein GLOIN_2v1481953 [Rhizophagus irregularis DAOM 181602=DAOM 197198]